MSLLADYEQQYATLTAEITAEIGKLRLYTGVQQRGVRAKIDTDFSEARELLEQIGLEVRDADPSLRIGLTNKLNCYNVELKRLVTEYENVIAAPGNNYDSADEFDDIRVKDDQKQRLLESSDRIERTGNKLVDGYRIVLETEELGTSVLRDLHHQRETIQSARSKIRETNAELGRSSRILNSMFVRSLREKFVLYGVGLLFIIVVCLSIYFSLSK